MLFDEIPEKFNNKIKKYFKKIISTIIKYDNCWKVNGTYIPINMRTKHQRLIMGSERHINYMIEEFYLIKIWHDFCVKNDILYTIFYGNLIGLYRENDHLLYDDDIDIYIKEKKAVDILYDLWKISGEEHTYWDKNWVYKDIKMGEKDIILLRRVCDYNDTKSILYNTFKIKLNTVIYEGQQDLGGIDIGTLVLNKNNKLSSLIYHNVDITELNNIDDNNNNFPIVNYGPIKVRAINENIGNIFLNRIYGNNWKNRKHPSLK